ncbi:MAG TPA: hypothetical protein VMF11_11670 [Candidatus Baltobacteraceae bacterium]|nr:hypothetical protein [Candidatus Baltobacteraceae bacterium]
MVRLIAAFAAILATAGCIGTLAADQPVRAADRVAKTQPANLTRTSLLLKGTPNLVLGAFEVDGDGHNGAVGTIQPGAAIWNADSGTMLADRQINVPPNGNYTTALSEAGHDAPALAQTAGGGILAVYGAISTYIPYHPPDAWRCLGRLACEPFKFAADGASDLRVLDALANSPEYLLPSVGISEASYATVGAVTIIAGQQQPGSRYGQSGAQSYVTLHAKPGGGTFDTTAGAWDFRSSHVPPGDGGETLTLTPQDDAYADVGIVHAGEGPGTMTFDLGSVHCAVRIAAAGDAAAAATQVTAAFSGACPQARGRFAAVQVKYDPAMRVGGALLAPAVVGITTPVNGPLPPPQVHCDGALSCASPHGPDTMLVERGSGLHRHFLFGGVMRSGAYVYYLMDVEELAGSWYGRGESSEGLALACFRARAPAGDRWTWTNCAGRDAFTLTPGMRPLARLTPDSPYLVGAPQDGYRGGMAPYQYDWSMRPRVPPGIPVIAAVSATTMRDGDLMFVHGCETPDRLFTACYALYDTRSGLTRTAGTIDPSAGGSLASIAAITKADGTVEVGILAGEGDRWGCGAAGTCFLTYRYDARANRWYPLGKAPLGGRDVAGFPGSLNVEGERFLIQLHPLTGAGTTVETEVRS